MKPLFPLLFLSALLPFAAPATPVTRSVPGAASASVNLSDPAAPAEPPAQPSSAVPPASAGADRPDSLYLLLSDFEAEFARTQQTLRSNRPERPCHVQTVYDLYRALSDEDALLARRVIRSRRTGRYATAQERISFYPLPADSTLERVEAYLLALDSVPGSYTPCPEAFRDVDIQLQGPPRDLRKYVVTHFRPVLETPADSVVYFTPALHEKLNACLRLAWERGLPADVIERINALTPVKRGTWGGVRIVKPIVVNYMLLETGADAARAYVSVLNDDGEVFGLLFVLNAEGRWQLRTARMLGQLIA